MHQKICWVLFISYLVVLTYFMFFRMVSAVQDMKYAYNLILFKEIKRFYKYRELLGMRSFLLNTVGNVITISYRLKSFILPIISRRGEKVV